MKKNKEQTHNFILLLILNELKKLKHNRIIPFPMVYYRLGSIFHFRKDVAKKVLRIMENENLIKRIPFHGIRILNKDSKTCKAPNVKSP